MIAGGDVLGLAVRRGPLLYRVAGAETQLAATTTGTAFLWRWPRKVHVAALLLDSLQGTPASLGGLDIKILDHTNHQIGTDGTNEAWINALALAGFGGRWFPLDLDVQAGDKWQIQLRNQGAAAVDPRLMFRLEDPEP